MMQDMTVKREYRERISLAVPAMDIHMARHVIYLVIFNILESKEKTSNLPKILSPSMLKIMSQVLSKSLFLEIYSIHLPIVLLESKSFCYFKVGLAFLTITCFSLEIINNK